MEVIHSGNCDCPFPGRGCAWEVPWPCPNRRALPRASAHVRSPAGSWRPGAERRRKRQVRPVAGSALHLPLPLRRPPGGSRAPAPSPAPRFVPARLPVCGGRPRLTSRAGKRAKAASFSETSLPRAPPPASPKSPAPSLGARARPGILPPGTRGRCAAVGLREDRPRATVPLWDCATALSEENSTAFCSPESGTLS